MHFQLAKDVGGALRFTPPTMSRPSSPTVAIVDPSGVELDTPTATADAVNTTLSAAAAVAATTVTLTSVTGVTARNHYVLAGSDGEREWVRVRSVNTSTRVVTLYEPLANDYASGASFYGTTLSCTVDADYAADIDEGYEARWSWTADGESQTGITRYDVVRTAWPQTLTTLRELVSYAGGILGRDLQRGGDADWDDLLEHATDRVLQDVRGRGRDPSRFRAVEPWKRVVHEAVLLHLAETADIIPAAYRDNPSEWAQQRRSKYEETLGTVLAAAKDYDENQSGVVSAAEASRSAASVRLVI